MTSIIKNVFNLLLLLYFTPLLSQNIEHDAYDALKTEDELGITVNTDCRAFLDSIFIKAGKQIVFPEKIDDSAAYDICYDFSMILKDTFGISYKLVQTFSVGLENKVLDCNYYSLLFYTWLNKQNLFRVYPVVVPGHMFIRWYLTDSTYVNYETTTKELITDSVIRAEFRISEQAESSCLYMCPMSDAQLTAVHWAELAYDVADTNLALSIDLNKRALLLDSASFHIYNNLSTVCFFNNQPDSSDFYFQKALQLDSMNYTVYESRGNMFVQNEAYLKALPYFSRAIMINPNDPSLYMERCEAFIKLKELEPALADFTLANAKIDKSTFWSFFVNYPFLAYLDEQILWLAGED